MARRRHSRKHSRQHEHHDIMEVEAHENPLTDVLEENKFLIGGLVLGALGYWYYTKQQASAAE